MTNKRGAWHWYDPVYKTNFALVCSAPSSFATMLRRVLPEDTVQEIEKEGCADVAGILGRFVETQHERSGQIVAFYLNPGADVCVAAHECLHATRAVLEAKGLSLTRESEEAYTYYLEWLLREILNRVRPK